MPKLNSKKFILVSIDEEGDSTQVVRKLRRYLASHKLKHISSSSPEEMKDYIDLLQNNHLVFQEAFDDQNINNASVDGTTPSAPTNQELLEQWARGLFSDGSDAINMLFGTSSEDRDEEMQQDSNEKEHGNTTIDIPQLSMANSIESEANDPATNEDGKEDNQDMAYCLICELPVRIGRNRNTRIKRMAEHVIEMHERDEFLGVEIEKRYQCMQCEKMLPVSKSPCEHISDHHGNLDAEIEFRDLWTSKQTSVFNSVLGESFERHLPVPRSRRIRNGNTWVPAPKSSYRIVQGENVVQINSVAEKPKTQIVDKINKAEALQGEDAGQSVDHQDPVSSSEDDELFIHDDIESEECEYALYGDDHDYLNVGERKSTFDQN